MNRFISIFSVIISLTVFTSCNSNLNDRISTSNSSIVEETKPLDSQDILSTFVDMFNEKSDTDIANVLEIDIHEEHYRTEYRLNAFKNALAINGNIGEYSIDIVSYGTMANDEIRLYLSTDSIDFAEYFFKIALEIFDSSLTEDEILDNSEILKEKDTGSFINHITYYYNPAYKELYIDCSDVNFYAKK
ncbi:MAG: hypothetical protein NC320_13145 [Clostridium sp.]|nr:hypothetical protein [Clostridium sp.]